jgi:DNA-binding NarL/FixJ family response regulator
MRNVDADRSTSKLPRAMASPTADRARQRSRNPPVGLTERELEVLLVLVRGESNHEIAEHLGISPKTVGHHVQHVYRKAGVHSRAAATLWAFEHGLVRTRSGRHVA